jgi:hypothetical protein
LFLRTVHGRAAADALHLLAWMRLFTGVKNILHRCGGSIAALLCSGLDLNDILSIVLCSSFFVVWLCHTHVCV